MIPSRGQGQHERSTVKAIFHTPLIKLRAVNSTFVVTITLVEFGPFHVKHVRVLTLNAFPLGTSGVRVVVMLET